MPICTKCDGTGRVSCGACWNGQHHPNCPDCGGRGVVMNHGVEEKCTRCHGKGKFTPFSCSYCGNSTPCPACKGAGKI